MPVTDLMAVTIAWLPNSETFLRRSSKEHGRYKSITLFPGNRLQSRFTPSRTGKRGRPHGSVKWAAVYRLFNMVNPNCFSVASSMIAVSTNLRVLCNHLCLLWPMWSCIIYTRYMPRAKLGPFVDPRKYLYTYCSRCEHQAVLRNCIWKFNLSSYIVIYPCYLSYVKEGFLWYIPQHM